MIKRRKNKVEFHRLGHLYSLEERQLGIVGLTQLLLTQLTLILTQLLRTNSTTSSHSITNDSNTHFYSILSTLIKKNYLKDMVRKNDVQKPIHKLNRALLRSHFMNSGI